MGKFDLVKVEDLSKWDILVEESPQGTIFSNSKYLQATGREFDAYFLYKGEGVKAGLCVVVTDDRKEANLDDLVIYNGIMFKEDKDQKGASARIERFEITQFIIGRLVERYRKIEMALPPQFEDMRPFLGYNYHSPDPGDKFVIDLRYTSYLDVSEFLQQKPDEEMLLFKNMQRVRRRRVKEAIKMGVRLEEGEDVDRLIKYYREILISQGLIPSEEKLIGMKYLVQSLLKNNQAVMFFLREPDGRLSYAIVFCFDTKRAYALFAAGNEKIDVRYKGTMTYWEAFKFLANQYRLTEIDLEGVNNPERAWFKLTFGGNLLPYFQLYWAGDKS